MYSPLSHILLTPGNVSVCPAAADCTWLGNTAVTKRQYLKQWLTKTEHDRLAPRILADVRYRSGDEVDG